MKLGQRLPLRLTLLVVGSLVMGAGVALAVNSGMGGDPLAVLWDGISYQTGISIAMANLLSSLVLIVAILIIDWRQLNFGTIAYELIMAGAQAVVTKLVPQSADWRINAVMMVVGVAGIGIGIGIYAAAALGRGPYDGVVFGLHERFGWRIFVVRMSFDLLFLISGWLLGGTVGIGTLLALLLVGVFIEQSARLVRRLFSLPESFSEPPASPQPPTTET